MRASAERQQPAIEPDERQRHGQSNQETDRVPEPPEEAAERRRPRSAAAAASATILPSSIARTTPTRSAAESGANTLGASFDLEFDAVSLAARQRDEQVLGHADRGAPAAAL